MNNLGYIHISYIMIINLPNDIYKNLGYLSDKSRIYIYDKHILNKYSIMFLIIGISLQEYLYC